MVSSMGVINYDISFSESCMTQSNRLSKGDSVVVNKVALIQTVKLLLESDYICLDFFS